MCIGSFLCGRFGFTAENTENHGDHGEEETTRVELFLLPRHLFLSVTSVPPPCPPWLSVIPFSPSAGIPAVRDRCNPRSAGSAGCPPAARSRARPTRPCARR